MQCNQLTTIVHDLQIGYGHTFTIQFACSAALAATGYQNIHNPNDLIAATGVAAEPSRARTGLRGNLETETRCFNRH